MTDTEQLETRVASLEKRLKTLDRQVVEARAKAAEAAVEGLDGTAHHHDVPQLVAERETIVDALSLAQERLKVAREQERAEALKRARQVAKRAGKARIAAAEAVDKLLSELEPAFAHYRRETANHEQTRRAAGLKVKTAPARADFVLAAAFHALAPQVALAVRAPRIEHKHQRSMADTARAFAGMDS